MVCRNGIKERIAVIYPDSKRYAISEQIEAVPLQSLGRPGQVFSGDHA